MQCAIEPPPKLATSRPNLDPDSNATPESTLEHGETMDEGADEEDDARMMAMMGMSGFGTTKVRGNYY